MDKVQEKVDELRFELANIELDVLTGYTLADAMREGCKVTEKEENGWGNGATACAFSAARMAAEARGVFDK